MPMMTPAVEVEPFPQPLHIWDCRTRAQALNAAFEAHEVALHSGMFPDEATSLSLTLAELTNKASDGRATLFFGGNGWRLEVTGFTTPVTFSLNTLSHELRPTVLHVIENVEGDEAQHHHRRGRRQAHRRVFGDEPIEPKNLRAEGQADQRGERSARPVRESVHPR